MLQLTLYTYIVSFSCHLLHVVLQVLRCLMQWEAVIAAEMSSQSAAMAAATDKSHLCKASLLEQWKTSAQSCLNDLPPWVPRQCACCCAVQIGRVPLNQK
jgi:hypothetical protein